MVFDISLYLSLMIFSLGLIFKISTLFRYNFESTTIPFTARERFFAAMGGIVATP